MCVSLSLSRFSGDGGRRSRGQPPCRPAARALSAPMSEWKEAKEAEATLPFEIAKWDAVCFWKWERIEMCAICRNELGAPSINYESDPGPHNHNGLRCAFGSCNHAFHLDCINRWINDPNQTRTKCPLCRAEWDTVKVEVIPGYEAECASN